MVMTKAPVKACQLVCAASCSLAPVLRSKSAASLSESNWLATDCGGRSGF